MSDFKVEVGKIKKPASLTTFQMSGTMKEGEVLMVCKNLNRKRGAAKVLMPGFEGLNDHKEFPIVDVIIAFGRDEGLGEI
jgi:hypothetical protein